MMKLAWILLTGLLFSCGYSQEVTMDAVEEINGLTCLKGSHEPFTGKTVAFHTNGKKSLEIEYRNGVESGTNRTWYNTGQLMNETQIDSGKIHGLWIDYFPDGKKQNEVTYETDYMNGPCTRWYENGQIKESGSYVHCREEGEWTYYWPNGKRKAKGTYHEAIRTGTWEFFNEQGEAATEAVLSE